MFLKQYDQWLTWKLVTQPGKTKPTKIPIGSTTNPATWTDHTTAQAAAASDPSVAGIGFVFTDEDPFVFLDIDGCGEPGNWSPHALAAFAALPGATWETSQSGHGLHAIARVTDKSAFAAHRNVWRDADGNKFEFYVKERFMALGRGDWSLPEPQDATDAFLAFIPQRDHTGTASAHDAALTSTPRDGYNGPADDTDLITRACKAKGSAGAQFGNRATFDQLWRASDALGSYFPDPDGTRPFDHSSADAALMDHLAFWTGCDEERMTRLFAQSALGVREKWIERGDYRTATVRNATRDPNRRYMKHDAAPVALPAPAAVNPTLSKYATAQPDKNDHRYMVAIMLDCGFDVKWCDFRSTCIVDGEKISDGKEIDMWFAASERACLNFPKAKFQDAILHLSRLQRIHPVREYLDAAQKQWDKTPRLDKWLVDYAAADDTPYTRAVSAATLIAAVRRVRQPGCKHDEMLTLQGVQGAGKSTLFETLCPNPEWFSDAINTAMDTKQIMEVTQGKWIVEVPELSKMGGTETEHIKALLSRKVDSARMSYGKHTTDAPRQFVMVGTTNADQFLLDDTGNRRFWPVRVGTINTEAITDLRDQLWAEAAVREARGESNGLAPAMWTIAAAEQASRMLPNPYEDALRGKLGSLTGTVTLAALQDALEVRLRDRRSTQRHIVTALREMGWKYDTSAGTFTKGDPARTLTAFGGTISANPATVRAVK